VDDKAIFYVYAYLRKDNITPYYIGKGKGRRAFNRHTVTVPSDRSKIKFFAQKLFENEAFLLEKQLISYYGRKDINTGVLHNLTDGGEGSSGYRQSDDQKKHMSKMFTGKPRPEYVKIKMSEALKGKYKNPKSEGHKIAISNSLRGKLKSEAHKNNLSTSHLGKSKGAQTLEHREKISNALKGKSRSSSHTKNHAASLITNNALRKELGIEKKRNIKQVECPHCGKIGGGGAMTQFHFNKCKKYDRA
jgi:hypothetical protein